jgi:hypothetical protein
VGVSLYVQTCYRCPKRGYRFARNYCQILDAKLKAVKGLGLTRIAFKCEVREGLFPPGAVVRFERWEDYDDHYSRGMEGTGIVMRTKGRKVLIYSEDIERTVSWWYPDKLQDTGKRASVCRHCGRPEGKTIQLPHHKEAAQRKGSPHVIDMTPTEWECTSDGGCSFAGPTP